MLQWKSDPWTCHWWVFCGSTSQTYGPIVVEERCSSTGWSRPPNATALIVWLLFIGHPRIILENWPFFQSDVHVSQQWLPPWIIFFNSSEASSGVGEKRRFQFWNIISSAPFKIGLLKNHMFLSKKSLVRYAHSFFETYKKTYQTLCDGSEESAGHLTTLLGCSSCWWAHY